MKRQASVGGFPGLFAFVVTCLMPCFSSHAAIAPAAERATPPDYGPIPIEWTVAPELEAELAQMRANDRYQPQREHTRAFIRTQVKYGLERDDYLHKWYDRPLMADVRYLEKNERGCLLNIESWKRMAELARLCGHGFSAFTDTKGREIILSRSVTPGAECEILVESVMGGGNGSGGKNKLAAALQRIEKAMAAPNAFRINGKLVITAYPEIRVNRIGEYAGLKAAIAERWGDKVALMPYFTPFALAHGRMFTKREMECVKENLRKALRIVDGICFSAQSVMNHNRRTNPAFAVNVMAPVIHSVLSEPEFKGRLFGMVVSCGHENCYRWNYAKDCTGTRWLRDHYEVVKAFRPDFINATEWDEENENTHHRPTIAQGFVMQRLARFITADLDGRAQEPWPNDDVAIPNLAVSYRKALLAGEPIEVEVLNIPDGTFAGQEVTVRFRWLNAAGKVVKSYEPKKLSTDRLEAAWFVSPVTELVAEPILKPELTVWYDGKERVFSEGLWPLSLHVNRSIEFRWVKQSLREKTPGVKSTLSVGKATDDGTVVVSGTVESPVPLRSVEVLDGPDTAFLYDPSCKNPHADGSMIVKVAWQGLTYNTTEYPTGSIRLANVERSHIMSRQELNLSKNANFGTIRNAVVEGNAILFDKSRVRKPAMDGWENGLYVRIESNELDRAEFVVDLEPYFKATLRAADILAKDVVAYPAAGGMNLVFRRWLTPVVLQPPCGGYRAEFSFRMKPTSPDSVLRIQTVDERFNVDYGASHSFFRPSGKKLRIAAYERDAGIVAKADIDDNRAVKLDYAFSPERGGVVSSGAGLGCDGILGGYNTLISGYGAASPKDGNVVDECARRGAKVRGWPNTVPRYVREPDGSWSLQFEDAAFVALPQQVIPAYGGFCLEMEVFPDEVERKQGLLTTGPNYFNLGIENGRVFADVFLRNAFFRSPRKERADQHMVGPKIEKGEWNRVVVYWDRCQFRIDVNDVRGVSYDVAGDLLYARHTALGALAGSDAHYHGRMRRVRVTPLSSVWDHNAFEDLVGKRCWPRDYRGSLFANPPKGTSELAGNRYVTIADKPAADDLSAEQDRIMHRRRAVVAGGPDYGSDAYCAAAVIGGRVPLVPDESGKSLTVKGLISDLCEDEGFSPFERYETAGSPLHQHSVFRGGTDVWANRGEGVWEVSGKRLPKDGFYGRNEDLEAGICLIGGRRRAFAVNRKEARGFFDARDGGPCEFGGVKTGGAFILDAHNDWLWTARPLPGRGAFTATIDPVRLFGKAVPRQTVRFAGDDKVVEIRFPEPKPIDLQRRIDTASARGGGTVVIPRGDWVSKPLLLKSGVTLHFEDGARLCASTNISDYAKGRGQRVFLFADQAENIAITGRGTLDGRGYMFAESVPLEGQSQPQDLPVLMRFSRCRNVRLEDFTYCRSGAWGCHLRNSDGVIIRRVRCFNHCNKTNDGIDCESRNVLIEDCDIDADDDAICIKAESDIDFVVSNVVIRSCRMASCCNGFKVGTGSWAPVRDVLVENCRVERPRGNWRFRWFDEHPGMTNRLVGGAAICLGTVDGGSLENVTVRDMSFSGVTTPIAIRLGVRNACRAGHETYSRNILIENVRGTCDGTVPSTITGVPGLRVQNVVLRNVDITCPGNGEVTDAPVPERVNGYPGPGIFEAHTLPAYGFYLRHVDGVNFENVRVRAVLPEARPALYKKDCLSFRGDCMTGN